MLTQSDTEKGNWEGSGTEKEEERQEEAEKRRWKPRRRDG